MKKWHLLNPWLREVGDSFVCRVTSMAGVLRLNIYFRPHRLTDRQRSVVLILSVDRNKQRSTLDDLDDLDDVSGCVIAEISEKLAPLTGPHTCPHDRAARHRAMRRTKSSPCFQS